MRVEKRKIPTSEVSKASREQNESLEEDNWQKKTQGGPLAHPTALKNEARGMKRTGLKTSFEDLGYNDKGKESGKMAPRDGLEPPTR